MAASKDKATTAKEPIKLNLQSGTVIKESSDGSKTFVGGEPEKPADPIPTKQDDTAEVETVVAPAPLSFKVCLTAYAKQLVDEGKFKAEDIVPAYQTPGAACLDLVAICEQHVWPGEITQVRTGIGIQLPEGFEAVIRPRSGLYFKKKIEAFQGTIDSDYRGEVIVGLHNLGRETIKIEAGSRIAQLAIKPAPQWKLEVVDKLDETERGEDGFGSTDKKDKADENDSAQ